MNSTAFRFSQFRVNMASGVLSSLVGAALTAIAYPVSLHYLGYEKYGLWLLLTTILTFSQLGNLGIAQAVSKEVAQAHGVGDFAGIQACVTNAVCLLLLSGSVVTSALLIGKAAIISGLHLSAENAQIAATVIPYIGCLSVYVFIVDATNAVLAGIGRMDICNYNQLAAQLLSTVLGIALMAAGTDVFGLLAANALSYLCLHIGSLCATRHLLKGRLFALSTLSLGSIRHLLGFGLSLTAGSLLAMFLNPLNKIVLARFAGLATVPIYDLSFTGCMRIRNLLDSSQRAIIPEVSRLLKRSTAEAYCHARSLNRQSIKLILCVVPLFVALFASAPFLLRIWLGSRFDPTSPFVVRVMLIGVYASLLGMPAYYTLIGLGKVTNIFAANCMQLLVNVFLIALAFTLYAKITAGFVVISTSVAMACSTAYLMWSCARITAPVRSSALGEPAAVC